MSSSVSVQDSILDSTKKQLGIDKAYTAFDVDIIFAINTAINILNQMGVGTGDFTISDNTATWSDLLGANSKRYEMVKTWMYMKTRLIFDPPQNSSLMEAMNNNLKELEWRIFNTANY